MSPAHRPAPGKQHSTVRDGEGHAAVRGSAVRVDLVTVLGKRFGRLTALGASGEVDGATHEPTWYFECACHRAILVEAPSVVAGWAATGTACCRQCLFGREEWSEAVVDVDAQERALAWWRARMVGVCAHCGLRRLDELGKCGACGGRKARVDFQRGP